MRLISLPVLSALYYALLQCGYAPWAQMGRCAAHGDALAPFTGNQAASGYFSAARQDTCEAYPWWPRAFLLEDAALCLNGDCTAFSDPAALRERISGFNNIAESERDDRLFHHLSGLPDALRPVLAADGFARFRMWEQNWLREQHALLADELSLLENRLTVCMARYPAPVRRVEAAVSPIKCVYASDCHRLGDTLLFFSGTLRAESVVHEYLHYALHPAVAALTLPAAPLRYPGLDDSYYLAGPSAAFEEHAVRALTQDVLASRYPKDIPHYLHMLLHHAEKEFPHD